MSSPSRRLRRRYRVMWNDDDGTASHYHPLINQGANKVGIRLRSRDLPLQVQEEAPIDAVDVELEIRYLFPDGKGSAPRGYRPRT